MTTHPEPEATMFNTIVVGVDGREGGRDALSLATRLALLAGGELVAVRALPFDYYVSRAGAPPYASIAEQDAKAELRDDLEKAGVQARSDVVGDSSAAHALHRVAEAEQADLIVVGSTHHGRAGRVLAGDDAAATVHGASCPVAVAPRGLAGRESSAVTRIGVGYDARAEARQALGLAVDLARDCGAALELRSVVTPPTPDPDGSPYDRDWLERAMGLAEQDLNQALEAIDVEATGSVVAGLPVRELVELSREVDLLVVGSRAWGPVRRILVGSTAANLMRESHCPVLVLPRGVATGEPGEREFGVESAAAATVA
jgi:nucleotide-binding universal stress UspA family protein